MEKGLLGLMMAQPYILGEKQKRTISGNDSSDKQYYVSSKVHRFLFAC